VARTLESMAFSFPHVAGLVVPACHEGLPKLSP
jgi:hypothetical protein